MKKAKRPRSIFFRTVIACLAILLAGFCVLEAIIITGGRSSKNQSGDALIVLGAQVYHSGPSPVLKRRLQAALDYIDAHPDENFPIIVSGAQGQNELETEAQAMETYLVSHGVDKARIHQEDASYNTYQNLENSAKVLQSLGYDLADTRVMIVSNNFHLARVRMLAERCGLNAGTRVRAHAGVDQHPVFLYERGTGAGEVLPARSGRSQLKKSSNLNDKGASRCSINSNKWNRTTASCKRS